MCTGQPHDAPTFSVSVPCAPFTLRICAVIHLALPFISMFISVSTFSVACYWTLLAVPQECRARHSSNIMSTVDAQTVAEKPGDSSSSVAVPLAHSSGGRVSGKAWKTPKTAIMYVCRTLCRQVVSLYHSVDQIYRMVYGPKSGRIAWRKRRKRRPSSYCRQS